MRIEKENGIITLMRGDSLVTPIFLNVGTKLEPIYKTLGEKDKLYFALMEPNQAFEDAVVKKVYDCTSDTDSDGNVLLKLSPKDTEHLLVGKYYYTVKYRTFNEIYGEIVKTIIPPTLFWLTGSNPVDKTNTRQEKIVDNFSAETNQESISEVEIILEGGEVEAETDVRIIYEGGEII